MSGRAFADTSRGSLDNAGSLPLQPATRVGVDLGYRHAAWRGGVSLLRALRSAADPISDQPATSWAKRARSTLPPLIRMPTFLPSTG
jgi:iron complex outermembrane receptor protein